MTPPDMKPKDRALLAFDKINEKLERDCGAAATFIGTKEYEWIETACVESAIAAREEGRKEAFEEAAKLCEMPWCLKENQIYRDQCAREIRAAGKEKKE